MNALFIVLLAVAQAAAALVWGAGDRATIERIIAPDWTTTGPDGAVRTRSQVLSEVFDTRVHRIQQMAIDGVSVRLFGESAVVSGRTHAVGDFGGQMYEVRIRFTDVFVRRRGQWQAVASHASLLSNGR